MGAAERDLITDARAVVRSRLPGYRIDSIVRLGAGLENVAYEVNNDLIVRFSVAPDPAARAAAVQREAGVLETVAVVSPLTSRNRCSWPPSWGVWPTTRFRAFRFSIFHRPIGPGWPHPWAPSSAGSCRC